MNIPPTIRAAEAREAGALTELAMRSKAHWGYSKSFMEACREELTVTPQAVTSADFHYRLAERDATMMGFYALEKLGEHEFELEALFVDPKFIGNGIGRALMDDAKKLAGELGGHTIIIQGDPNAEKFYRAAGGKPSGMRASGSIPGRSLPLFTIHLDKDDIP